MTKDSEFRGVGLFTLISFLYSWPIFFAVDAWLIPLFVSQDRIDMARLTISIGHMLGMLGPALAAFVMWRVFDKVSSPAWKWSQPKYYVWALLAMFGFWVVPGFINLAFGDAFVSPIEPSMWMMIGAFLIFGWFSGMGEEIGWCAYLLPRLSPKIGKSRAMIVSGAIRGLWHWPVLVGPIIARVVTGENTVVELLIFAVVIAIQLILSNIAFGGVFGWIWYRTESMPLVGWLHQWYDLTRDAMTLLLVGYGSSLWATLLSVGVFSGVGLWLIIRIGQKEGASFDTLFKPADASV